MEPNKNNQMYKRAIRKCCITNSCSGPSKAVPLKKGVMWHASNLMNEISVQCRGDRIYRFSPETTALLVIDLQKEFFTDDIGECFEEMQSILPRVATIIA